MKLAGTSYTAKINYGQIAVARDNSRAWLQSLRLPGWGWLLMVFLAAAALALTVIARERTQLREARGSYAQTIQRLKQTQAQNETLKAATKNLRVDARAGNNTAQDSLNLIRANEIVVPVR